jgi:hypothetical protein
MATEVDRLLIWMKRVEQLEDELHKANPAAQEVIHAQLVPAQRAQSAAFTALVAAAHRGDPEALVALDALETEIEEKTWSPPSPLLQRDSRDVPSRAIDSREPRSERTC